MFPLVLVLAMVLSKAASNLTQPLVDNNLIQPLVSTHLTQPPVNFSLSRPVVESDLILPPVDPNISSPLTTTSLPEARKWTFRLQCYACSVINTFRCAEKHTCPMDIRRCMIVAIRMNPRELLVYKNCTGTCTFLYPEEQPPEAYRKLTKVTNFYYVHCCGSMACNVGGPSNVERDLHLPEPIEESEPEGAVRFGESAFSLSLASILISNTLT